MRKRKMARPERLRAMAEERDRSRKKKNRSRKRKVVHLERLRAAWQAKGGTWHQLAKAAGVPHPTLSRLNSAGGPTKAVSAATLARLAAALKVPAAWLIGKQPDLPYVPEWDLARREGEAPSLWERPTQAVVRWSWLMQRIDDAIHRDLREWYGENDAGHAYHSWGRALLGVFTELASFMSWRMACLDTPGGNAHILKSDDSPAISWLEELFDPWFAGGAYLNADVVRRVFEALLANPGRTWESPILDADGLRALGEYTKACDVAVGKRLEAGLGPEAEEEPERGVPET